MKAKKVLEWICRESINGEHLNVIKMPAWWDVAEEWYEMAFGAIPEKPLSCGTYLYFYDDTFDESIIASLGKPDAVINHINFYRLD